MAIDKTKRKVLKNNVSSALVWDNHACMPLHHADERFLPQLENCHAAGIDVITLNVAFGATGIARPIRMLALFRDWIARHSNFACVVTSVADARAAKKAGKLGICFDIEGMDAVADQPNLVRLYYDLGVRWMLITYNRANAAGGGCLDEPDAGLTDFGRRVIAEMNAVGMMLCCSHAGYRTARDAIEASADPVIFSHSNPRALWDHPRNIPDDLMRACAERGGIIGLNGLGLLLGRNDASIGHFVEHVEYAMEVVGENHVSIGLDYEFDQAGLAEMVASNPHLFPPEHFPYGSSLKMIPPWAVPEIAEVLDKRGHSAQAIGKLLGGNLMRVAENVWH